MISVGISKVKLYWRKRAWHAIIFRRYKWMYRKTKQEIVNNRTVESFKCRTKCSEWFNISVESAMFWFRTSNKTTTKKYTLLTKFLHLCMWPFISQDSTSLSVMKMVTTSLHNAMAVLASAGVLTDMEMKS